MACVKCRTEEAPHRIRHVNYCDTCLIAVIEQKYRAAIVRSTAHIARHTEPIKCLIAISGGSSSRALLHLSNTYRTQIDRNDIRYKFDDGVVLMVMNNDCDEKDFDMNALAEQYPRWKFVQRTYNDLFSSDSNNLNALMEAVTTPTSRSDLQTHLLMHLILSTAREHDCKLTLLGDSATQSAIRALSSVSKGRGYSLASDTAESVLLDDMLVVRPLLSHLKKETELYCLLNHLTYVDNKNLKENSIDALTSMFINSLDAEFPSTVSTITRTVAKLHKPSSDYELNCVFCHALIQDGCHSWRDQVTVNKHPFNPEKNTTGESEGDNIEEELARHLCYGCLNIRNDLIWNVAKNRLPNYVQEGIKKNQEQVIIRKMKQSTLLGTGR